MQMVTSSIPTSLTAGRLEGIGIPELLWNLCRRRSTGVLYLTVRGVTKKVYISEGRIIFAASGDPDDRLGEMLLRDGTIRLAALERATTRLHEGKRLGTLLVEAGDLSPEQLVRSVVGQVRAIVLGLFRWEDGEYRFDEGSLPTEEVITLGMRTGEILLQGIRSVSSFSRIRRSVGSDRARFRAAADWRAVVEGLALGDGERSLLERLEGDGETVDRLCEQVSLSNFEVYQAIWAFRVLGAVHDVDRSLEFAPSGAAEGSLAAEGFPRLLVRLCRQGETGVLHVARGNHERTFHIREGRCVFATSNNVDDGLLSHLLRRGVISIRDREETAKRLLSNKRVGTILLEMGVIDELDLSRLVREQLSEVLYDTFRWSDGEWTFGGGELPTMEGITVDRSLENLVLEGTRRVTSWARVREGLGGLRTRLVLTSDYLSVLDRMAVGPDDWSLVTRFRTPQTVMDVCASGSLPDFRLAQTLWALRLLGVVEEVAADDAVDLALTGVASEAAARESNEDFDAGPTASVPDEPEPIPPVAVDADRPFEITTPEEIEPVSAIDEDGSVVPSEWREPEGEEPGESWTAPDDRPALEVSEAEETEDAVVNEPWRLVAEDARETFSRSAEVAEEEGAVDDPDDSCGFEMAEPVVEEEAPRLPAWGLESEIVEADREPVSAPDWVLDEPGPQAEPISSGNDQSTVRIPREEVEAALRGAVPEEEPVSDADPTPAFEETVAETVVVPEQADASVASTFFPEEAPAEAPPWDPPAHLDAEISRFNGRHKALFRVLRSELGAGAVPFVKNCRAAVPESLAAAFGEATLLPDGTWDSVELKKAVCEARCDSFDEAFRLLLNQELERIRPLIGEKRASALEELLEGVH